jgi:predicted nicotinamide N-methyase
MARTTMGEQDLSRFGRIAQTVSLGAMTVPIETVQAFDALLDHYAAAHPADVDSIPYFAQLWPAAVALAKFLVAPPAASATRRSLDGVRAVELGCGLGLPSIVAARLGAKVLAVDFHPANEPLFRRNAQLNGVVSAEYLAADWGTLPDLEPFDLVLGSDLLYERRSLDSLLSAVDRICARAGLVLFSDPGRDAVQPFIHSMESRGFRQWTHVVDECFVTEFSRRN